MPPFKNRHNIFIFFAIFVIVYGFFVAEIFIKNIKIFLNFDQNIPEVAFNSSLKIAKNNDFETAEKLLPQTFFGFEEKFFELQGDIFFGLQKNSQEIIEIYKKSITLENRERILHKISLLEGEKTEKNSEKSQETTNPEIQKHIEKILEDQKNREKFLNSGAGQEKNFENDIKNLKNLLQQETIGPIKDW